MLGDVWSARGARETMGTQIGLFRESMANNNAQAQINRDWEERMSDTQMQRRMADNRAAGVNPLLAVGQGGASSPMASAAQSPSQPSLSNPDAAYANLGSIGVQVASARQAMAQARSIEIDNDAKSRGWADGAVTKADDLYDAKLRSELAGGSVSQATVDKVKTDTINALQSYELLSAQTTSANAAARNAQALSDIQVKAGNIGNSLLELKTPEAQAQAELFKRFSSLPTEGAQGMLKLVVQMLFGLFDRAK